MKKIDGKTAKKYAKSLLDAKGLDDAESLRLALRALAETWKSSKELREIMGNPSVAEAQKEAVLRDIAGGIRQGDEAFGNFLVLLLRNRRLSGIDEISQEFASLVDVLKKRLKLRVVSAFPLEEGERSSLETKLRQDFGGLATLRFDEDPSLLGGLVLEFGDRRLDSSIRGSLSRLRTALLH